jgi:hypothetical protein
MIIFRFAFVLISNFGYIRFSQPFRLIDINNRFGLLLSAILFFLIIFWYRLFTMNYGGTISIILILRFITFLFLGMNFNVIRRFRFLIDRIL